MDNTQFFRKADLTLGSLTDNGHLLPEAARTFLRILIRMAVMLPDMTVVGMRSNRKYIDKLRFAERVLQPATPGEALLVAERARPNLGPRVELDAQGFKAEIRLTDEVLQDQIEGGNLKQTVMVEAGKAISRDWEDLLINGDRDSTDPYLSMIDGMLEQATSNIVDGGDATTNRLHFRDLMTALPIEFHILRRNMRFYTSSDAETAWRDLLTTRQTPTGDRALAATGDQALNNVGAFGVPVVPVPLFPQNLGPLGNQTNLLFLDPKNVQVGIWRRIEMETDRDVSAGQFIMVFRLRGDARYQHEPAVARATGIRVN